MDLKRVAAGSVLVLILLSLCIYYDTHYEDSRKYPSTAAIESHYPEGSLVFVSGAVVRPNNNGFYLRDNDNRTIVYTILSSGQKVSPGDHVQLLGILGHSYTIQSTKVDVETNWGYEFILFRSALAFIVLIFLFFMYWKFDFKTFEFVKR